MEADYDAYRKVLEMEVLFSGSDSGMLRKIRTLTDEERKAFDSDIRDWLEEDGILDEDGRVLNAQRFL